MTKLNISVPQELLDEIDSEASALGITRSGLIQEASVRYVASARENRNAETRRLRLEAAARRMRRIGAAAGLTGDAVQLVANARAAEDARHGR